MLRDVTIISGDFVKTGGMDRANYALATYLSRCGSRVELVAHRVAADLVEAPGVTFRRVPKPLESYMLGEPLVDFAGRRAARAARARGGVAIVNGGNCIEGPVNWVHYVHAAYEPPATLSVRGGLRAWHGYRHRARERSALRLARLVLCNSAATRRVVVERLGVSPERAVVVYYGIDPTLFRPASRAAIAEERARLGWPARPAVAFVGALGDRRKGFDTLFEAWRVLCRSAAWDVDLVAVGGGVEVEAWRSRARDTGLGERVRILGFRTDVARILSACDALVAPTRYEAFGLGVAEALAMGVPAFVSASAGVAELYPVELAELLLDDPQSVDEIVRKIGAWRSSSTEASVPLRALSERVRARSWDDMAREISELIEQRV
jgi:glycosyltransferase involved in cell wall biosynthesis